MDFEKVVPIIIKQFDKAKVRYAIMGGFAMGALGMMRATMDIDVLIDSRDLPAAASIMKSHGYKCVYSSDNVSQYVADIKIFGEIDFLHAFRDISMGMLSRAKKIAVFEGKLSMWVLLPEDIIGLKLQAAENNSQRLTREDADIEAIARHFGKALDWTLAKDYFAIFGRQDQWKRLKDTYGKA